MKIEFFREIDAPKDRVWQVITDFAAYSDWNPFVTQCSAELTPGAPIAMTVVLRGRSREQVEFVSQVVPGRLFEYRMKPVGVLLHSRRQHEVSDAPDGKTQYRTTFELHGWLSGLVGLMLGSALRTGFQGMTDNLVRRAESLAHADSPGSRIAE